MSSFTGKMRKILHLALAIYTNLQNHRVKIPHYFYLRELIEISTLTYTPRLKILRKLAVLLGQKNQPKNESQQE